MKRSGSWVIQDGTLVCNGAPRGKITFEEKKVTLADKTYSKFSGFKEERYSSLSVKEDVQTQYDYRSHSVSVPVNIIRPIPAGTLSALTKDTWMKDIKIENGVVTFEMEENNSGVERTGMIVFHYVGAEDVMLNFTQSYTQSEISLSVASQQVGYEGGSFSFDFEVTNPREGASVTAQSQASWITDVVVDGNKVSFKIEEDNSYFSKRTGTIFISYGCANGIVYDSKRFTVLQEYEIDPTSANCYVISTPGTRQIKAVYGNSRVLINNIASVEVLWESFGTATAPLKGDIIQSVSYAAGSGSSAGTITFSTPSTLRNGNAVIAAKDASGNILWSWHIWVCKGYDPAATAHTYYNNAGVMMDRNLGATSATPGNVGALGLLYQWGRKDPFLGSSSISSETKAASTLSWPSNVSSNSSDGTIAYATAHPTTFITYNSSNYDWYYTGSSSTDNTRWQSSKTIYDPCPPGWRVPDGGDNGIWFKAVGSSSSFTRTYDSTKEGINFSGKFGSTSTIWYPASGYLFSVDGSLLYVGYGGYWWSCTLSDSGAYILSLYNDGDVDPSGYDYRAYGLSVRCLQE